MARLGEVPLAHYYGTVDATPLYVMLAGISTRPGTSKRSPQSGQISRRLCNGSTRSSTRMEKALSNMRGKTCRALSTKAGRILTIRSFTPMAH
jgi:hypothetical protein